MSKTPQTLAEALHNCCTRLEAKDLETNDRLLSASYRFPAEFPGFAGHFPGYPVLPAIIQLAAVRHTAELGLGRNLQPTTYSRTKFRTIIQSDEEITISLNLKAEESGFKGSFSINRANGEKIADGSCHFNSKTEEL